MSASVSAKDSTLVVKVGLGFAWNHWLVPKPYSGSLGSFYNHTDSTYLTEFSPSAAVQVKLENQFREHTSLVVKESFSRGALEYTRHETGANIVNGTWTDYSSTEDHHFTYNLFTTAVAIQLHHKNFYGAPVKLNFSYCATNEIIQSSGPGGNKTTKKNDFLYGAGILAGYNFHVKKHLLFAEYQLDLLTFHQKNLSLLNNAFVLGLAF